MGQSLSGLPRHFLKISKNMRKLFAALLTAVTSVVSLSATAPADSFTQGAVWPDTEGRHINAHGGGLLYKDGLYYWYGEQRPENGFTSVGVSCYSSPDLINWTNRGTVLATSSEPGSDIESGCIIERPKVVFNEKTGKYVMWFHLELKGQGYGPARAGVAVSDSPVGPFVFLRSGRVNPGKYPANLPAEYRGLEWNADSLEWWTPEWRDAVRKGLFVQRDLPGGQMSRDMTVFVDSDGKAYHIYSSEENLTLHIAELTDDYTAHTGNYVRIFPGGHNEAPAIFRHNGRYWMITSGCTGWAPNEARLMTADSIMGEWKQLPNPCCGKDAEVTFQGQSTYILPVQGADGKFLAMFDIWRPKALADSRYIWLPVEFGADGIPFVPFRETVRASDLK